MATSFPSPSVITLTSSDLTLPPSPALREILLSLSQKSFYNDIVSSWEAQPVPFRSIPASTAIKTAHWEYTRFLFKLVTSMAQSYTDTQLKGMNFPTGREERCSGLYYRFPAEASTEVFECEYTGGGGVKLSSTCLKKVLEMFKIPESVSSRGEDEDMDEDDKEQLVKIRMMLKTADKWALSKPLALMCEMTCPTARMSDDIPITELVRDAQNMLSGYIEPIKIAHTLSQPDIAGSTDFRVVVGTAVGMFREEGGGVDGDVGLDQVPIFQFGIRPELFRAIVRKVNGEGGAVKVPCIHTLDQFVVGDLIRLLRAVHSTWNDVLTHRIMINHIRPAMPPIKGWNYDL